MTRIPNVFALKFSYLPDVLSNLYSRFSIESTKMASANPPPGLLKLIAVVQKKFPGLNIDEARKVIINVRLINGGKLKGLKIDKFVQLVKKVVLENIVKEKHYEKMERPKARKLNKISDFRKRNFGKFKF